LSWLSDQCIDMYIPTKTTSVMQAQGVLSKAPVYHF
jgi:hypothetical protein